METIQNKIAATIARLSKLNEVCDSEPAFRDYYVGSGLVDPRFIQFHPHPELTSEQRISSGKAIARAFGGCWKTEPGSGIWRSGIVDGMELLLHDVDQKRPVLSSIDLG